MKNLHKLNGRWIAIAFAAIAAAGATATTALAEGSHMGHGQGHGKWQFDPAKADKHISMMVSHVLENGSPEQKARLTEIAKFCFRDIQPLKKQMGEGHAKIAQMLLQQTVDRGSVEVERTRNVQAMDQMSRRVVQAALDASEILTIEQREMFNHGLHLMAMSHMHGH